MDTVQYFTQYLSKAAQADGQTSTVFVVVFLAYLLYTLRNNVIPALVIAGAVTAMYYFNRDKLKNLFTKNDGYGKAEVRTAEAFSAGEVLRPKINVVH